MEDEEGRRNFRLNLFSSVGELADLDYQRATWLDPEMRNPYYSFVEFIECFYDTVGGDYDETDPEAYGAPLHWLLKDGHISNEESDAAWSLHLALKNYECPADPYDHQAILNDSAWHAVVATASQAKSQLLSLPLSKSERGYFSNKLPPASQKRWP